MPDPPRYPDAGEHTGLPRWVKMTGIIVAVVALLVVVILLVGGGGGHSSPIQHGGDGGGTPSSSVAPGAGAGGHSGPPEGAIGDHAARPAQVRAHRPRGVLGRLARRGWLLPGTRDCRSDQPGCSAGAWRPSRDGADRQVRHPSVGACFAADRDCAVTGHPMGLVPALLGPVQIRADHLFPSASC
jgi:hypothetical protein